MLVTSFEEAAAIRGIDVEVFEKGFDFLPEEHREGIKAVTKISIVNDELNKFEDGSNWTPDYNNRRQPKYELVYNMGSPSGSGFSYRGCVWLSRSRVGSRLVFRDPKIVDHAAEHFGDLHKTWMVYDRSQQGK